MEQAMFPQNENNTPFDNEALFDAEGHLTDEGLHALQDGRLDELGSLEAAEHLTFCDYCLARYTALIESAPKKLNIYTTATPTTSGEMMVPSMMNRQK